MKLKRRPTYRSLEEDPSYELPADMAVRIRVGRQDLRRIVADTSTAILKALGSRKRLWFRFEAAADELRARREVTYFDRGVEHGITSERAARLPGGRSVERLARPLLRQVLGSDVAREDAAAAAVMAAWAVLGGKAARRAPRPAR